MDSNTQATCCEHFTCIDFTQNEDEESEESEAVDNNAAKTKFSTASKVQSDQMSIFKSSQKLSKMTKIC